MSSSCGTISLQSFVFVNVTPFLWIVIALSWWSGFISRCMNSSAPPGVVKTLPWWTSVMFR